MEGPSTRIVDEIIIIEDDGDGEVENHDNRNGAQRFLYDCDSSSSSHGSDGSDSESSDDDDSSDEDCVVLEPNSASSSRRPRSVSDTNGRQGDSNDTSDCEIIFDTNGKVRQEWEEAAIRRRMASTINRTRKRAESEESTSIPNDGTSGPEKYCRGENHSHDNSKQEYEPGCRNARCSPAADQSSTHAEECHVVFDQRDSNPDVLNGLSEDTSEEASLPGNNAEHLPRNDAAHLQNNADNVVVGSSGKLFPERTSTGEPSNAMETSTSQVHAQMDSVEAVKRASSTLTPENLFTDREKLKETKEFQSADAQEWERRRMELEKQSQEAQRERKRRKVEGERRLEMENRQRQRLEEIRQTQLKEERTSGHKEKLRDQILSELDRIALTCKDMATLLSRLGIPVEGSPYPTNQQVNVAYKKALLRFHPDRVTAISGNDLSQQVKAEETFKLISRMKTVLPAVASGYLHSFVGSF